MRCDAARPWQVHPGSGMPAARWCGPGLDFRLATAVPTWYGRPYRADGSRHEENMDQTATKAAVEVRKPA